MGQKIVVVDAFANEPFTGNPAAVCVLPGPADERWMQLVAREIVGYQASVRGGIVHVRVRGDRVRLAGHALTILRGTLSA